VLILLEYSLLSCYRILAGQREIMGLITTFKYPFTFLEIKIQKGFRTVHKILNSVLYSIPPTGSLGLPVTN